MSGARTEVKRVGYAVAIGVNVLLLVVVNSVLGWGWFPWLTPEFGDVLPILNLALVFNIAVNVLFMFYDEPWLKSITQIVANVLAIVVLARTWQVYPFDFSAYDFPVDISAFDLDWDLVTHFILGLAIFGTTIAVVLEIVKLVRPETEPEATSGT